MLPVRLAAFRLDYSSVIGRRKRDTLPGVGDRVGLFRFVHPADYKVKIVKKETATQSLRTKQQQRLRVEKKKKNSSEIVKNKISTKS